MSDALEALERDWSAIPHKGDSDPFILGDIREEATILLIGEAPGADEQEQGRPFVGAAGVRLDDTLEKVRLDRKDLSITNAYPRRPDGNREPTKAEIEANRPFVDRLIKLHPNLKAIGLLGGVALKSLTGQEKIESYRGEQFQRDNVWYVPMYHPAAVLYQQSNLKWLVQDLSWLKTLSEDKAFDVSGRVFTYYDDEAFSADRSGIEASPMSYLDIESAAPEGVSPLWWWDSRVWPVLMSFGWYEGDSPEACVVEVNEKTLPLIRDLMATPVMRWGGSNSLYFDFPFLRKRGMAPTCKAPLDSYPISRLNDENRGCGLKDLAKRHFSVVGHTPYWGEGEEKVWHSRWRRWAEMGQPEREERIRYSGLDAWLGVQVLSKEIARLKQKPHLVSAYVRAVLPQADAIEEMNAEGMPLDVDAAKSMMAELEATKTRLVQQIGSLVPTEAWPQKKTTRSVKKEKVVSYAPVKEINFVSYQQVGHILFKGAGLPATKRTKKTGSDSSDEEALLKLMDLEGGQYPSWAFSVIRGVLDVRDATKKHGYVEALLKASDASEDHRVHGTFKIGPVTWRLASEDPNEQQLDSTIKALFRAPEGWTFVKFDHNALEVRGLADQSRDPKLVQRLLENMDLHWVHATGFLGRDYDSTVEHAREGENDLIRYAFKTLFFLCVPTSTKVLTKRGWLAYDQIRPGEDQTLGYNTGRLEWTTIRDVVRYSNAPLVRLANRTFSATCTPGHKWLSLRRRDGGRKGRYYALRFQEVQNIGPEDNIILGAPADGGLSPLMPDEAAVIAWLHTDGHMRWSQDYGVRRRADGKLYAPAQAKGRKVGIWACVYQRKPHPDLRALMSRVGARPYRGPGGTTIYGLPPQYVRNLWAKARLYDRPLESLMLDLSPAARKAFVEAGLQAEGSKKGKSSRVFAQNEGPILDAFRLAFYLEGWFPRTSGHGKSGYPLGRIVHLGKPRVTGQRLTMKTVPELSDVFCIQTDLHTWVAREGNSIFLTGNTGYGGGAKRAATAMRKKFYDAGIGRSVILRILEGRKIRPNSDPYLALAEAWLKWLKGEYPDLRKSFYRYGAPYDESRFDPNGYPVWRDRMVCSKFGFERRVPEIRDYDNQFRSEAHRQAYNFPSQNLSVLTFLAYRELRKLRADLGMEQSARLCLQEHDSKLWLVRKEEAAFWAEMVRGAMEQDYFAEFKTDFAVPLKVEGEIAEVWH